MTTRNTIKRMAGKRIKELEENIQELRRAWLKIDNELKALENKQPEPTKQRAKQTTPATKSSKISSSVELETPRDSKLEVTRQKTKLSLSGKTTSKVNISVTTDSEKQPTRALTRRESSRQNLEKTYAVLFQEATEIKTLNQLCKPSADVEKTLGSYESIILKHVDMNIIKRKYTGEIEDPYSLMNDFLLMFQNATMYYPSDHPTYKIAVEQRDKLVPQWERQIIERYKSKH